MGSKLLAKLLLDTFMGREYKGTLNLTLRRPTMKKLLAIVLLILSFPSTN